MRQGWGAQPGGRRARGAPEPQRPGRGLQRESLSGAQTGNPAGRSPESREDRRSQESGLPYCVGPGKTWRPGPQDPGVSAACPSALMGFYGNARSPLRRAAGAKQDWRRKGRAVCACSMRTRERAAGRGRPATLREGAWGPAPPGGRAHFTQFADVWHWLTCPEDLLSA